MLYPPYIDGKIVAQTGSTLKIPFEMNRAVSRSEVQSIKAKIKTATTSLDVMLLDSTSVDTSIVTFTLNEDQQKKLLIGQFYKIQLAYVDGAGKIGYYSTVGIFKYTAEPEIIINGLDDAITNQNLSVYQGTYKSEDATEKEYSYKFEVFDNEELFYTSGELIHNSENEVDTFSLPVVLSLGLRYTLKYTVTTINGLAVAKSYYITDSALSEIPSDISGSLRADLNYDEGCVSIDFIEGAYEGERPNYAGNYRLLRFIGNKYEIIDTFIISTRELNHIYNDYTIQQGVTYRYALQQVGNNIFGQKLYSNEVYADYEDMFLYDGERQLKIKYNPKVTSFKTTILEQKTDTLGGKYPVFFRNGNTSYKDFPISGLISMLADDNQTFMTHENDDWYNTNLTSDVIKEEREFKLKVLDWLNNGKPKLFRSPTEGNYVVRIMNVSLLPNDTLGRMLHTFSAQAYEIMDNSFSTLLKNGLIGKINDIISLELLQTELSLTDPILKDLRSEYMSITGPVGYKVGIQFAEGDSIEIELGYTGVYNIIAQDGNAITQVSFVERKDKDNSGRLVICYDQSVKSEMPLLFNGEKVLGIESYLEKGAQILDTSNRTVIDTEAGTNLLLDAGYHNFNIMALTLTTKISSNEYHLDTTLNRDPAGYVYSSRGVAGSNNIDYTVTIGFNNSEATLTLNCNTLFEDTNISGNKQPWKLDSFGNITITCDMFDNNLFHPTKLIIGNGVYANIYYSQVKYKMG